MEIYLIRHGETGGNVAKRHQHEATGLTPRGKAQAVTVAQIVRELQPTHLISSSHVRALETARVIAGEVCLVPETVKLFTELHRPVHLYGYRHLSPQSIWYVLRWYFGLVGGTVEDEMGESYTAIRQRVAVAKAYLELLPADAKVVVVSHSIFINLFIAHVCQERRLSLWQAFAYWSKVHALKNTEVKHLTFNKIENGCGWVLQK